MSSSLAKAAAGAMGSKAARACDGCLRRRARWYCAADDAFLCQACDASVHSANPLARRHERVRLRPTSPLQAGAGGPRARRGDEVVPAWFKRKPRTPRGKSVIGHLLSSRRPVVVPDEASGGEGSPEEHKLFEGETDEEELLYSVPVFDPALAELCSPSSPRHLEDYASCCNEDRVVVLESPTEPAAPSLAVDQFFPDSVVSFGPTDAELMEFAADMEALLGRGLDEGTEEEPFCMEALGLIQPMVDVDGAGGRVKMETDGEARGMFLACGLEREPETEVSGNMLGIDFDDDYGSPQATPDENAASGSAARFLPRSLSLNLNYEAIIDKWEKSPWADGKRPDVKLDGCWPHDYSMSVWMMGGVLVGHGTEELRTPRTKMDGGRDARVSRYREKRRTRLFSKKIRYEVRKLNAEKRPRMKGRFVKRANGVAVATACVA
ncbi:zinc finger protein CONSTANS-LIKE 16 [Brachypodium distachyon]|uniref:CCT domain-containing protein n=1 Tax=Brachypodium distachyon TaxID=15368 RepID=I1GZ67_BRADI|nr:zinc finger protein CONSTANS-LIKE 16 [Brachypodium distachyon]KQK18673.1 hypothetical protein BRADI_1g43990v3 [Brachypodium distachyon]|eukprot:XP_003560836.1 zinc finger protein CONSTANS-LIKE 16 [Brachypodium distachyon]